jgi:hypothetical protein
MSKVEFDAHKKVKLPAEVQFPTKAGEKVDFMARKPVEVPVHVKFRTSDNRRKPRTQ